MLQFLDFNSASTTAATADCLGAPRPQNVKKRKKEETSEATIAATTRLREEGDEDDQGEGATAELELEDRKEKRERRHTRLSGAGAPPVLLCSASPSRPGSVEDVGEAEEEEEEDLGESSSTASTLAAAQVAAAAAATLEGIPTEVLYLILGHLPPHELCRVALVCQRWHEAVADDFLWQRIHSALIAPCEQQSATASAAAADGEVSAPPAGRVWRQRCVEVACALQKYFGLELGQEADFTLSLSLTETKKIERVYPNLLWAVNYGYARIVERLLARMVALCPSAKPTSGGVVASLVNYKWRNTIFPNYNYPEWFEATLYESIVRYNDSLLHVAARKGFTMIVQLLLANGAAPDPPAVDLETPLYFAARFGHVEVLRILISHKAAVDSVNTIGGTPFHRAVLEGQVEAAAFLLSCGANVGHRQTQSRRNVLHEAVTTDRVALLEHLLALSSSSADDAVLRQWEDLTDQSDESGYTPLMLACKSGSVDMARLLRRVQVSAGGPERAANLSNAVALSRASNHAEALLALFPAEALRDDAAEAPPHDPHLE